MKNFFKNVLLIIISMFLGCVLMYGVIYFFPNTIIKTITKEQKVVNVIDDGIAEGINNVYDAVVVVETYNNDTVVSTGSGFAFKSEKGYTYLMTNHHVVDNSTKIIVIFSNSEEMEAELIGSDAYADVAVLKIKDSDSLKVSKIGDVSASKVGDTVFAVGSPIGKDYANTVTRGILSGKDRMIETNISSSYSADWIMNVMQTDAAINPGNSGGPLCNASGEIIGINSMKIVQSSVEGIGFAIPIDDALNYANSIIENGKIIRGYIGIEMINAVEKFQLLRNGITIDEDIKDGVVIVNSVSDSPAEKSGLKKGDVIVKINDDQITNIAEFRYYLYKNEVGSNVKISVYRDGKVKEISVIIGTSE